MRFAKLAALFALVGLSGLSVLIAQTAGQESPFQPGGGTASADSSQRERFELAGISAIGAKTSVCIYDNEKKQNRWLAVGESGSGVEVISCDTKANQATVKIGGKLKVLSLRKSVVSTLIPSANGGADNAAAPLPVVTPPPAEVAPESMSPQQVQEREARMLVSDLLEIGMQQRKAYEQKKAAEDAAKQTTPVPTPTTR